MADLIERARAEVDLRRLMFGEDRTKWSRADRMMEELLFALEAAREEACVALVADIRFACGDNGKRMQPELVEFIRELAADAERYRYLRRPEAWKEDYMAQRGASPIFIGDGRRGEAKDGEALDAAIDRILAGQQRGGRELRAVCAERDKLRGEVERLQRQLRQAHKDYGYELQDPNGTIWEHAAKQQARAERLAEALRDVREYVAVALEEEKGKFAGYESLGDVAAIEADLHKIDTALDQARGKGEEK